MSAAYKVTGPFWFAALEKSGILEALLRRANDKVGDFNASDVTFALDGLARLGLQPQTLLLDALADKVCVMSFSYPSSMIFLIPNILYMRGRWMVV